MGKPRKITIKTRTFEKAGDATAFFKDILNRYKIGQRVDLDDEVDLLALLERHDERDEKIGSGVAGFTVDVPPEDAPPFSKRCFWIVQNDGTIVDFSYKHCLERKLGD